MSYRRDKNRNVIYEIGNPGQMTFRDAFECDPKETVYKEARDIV